MSEVIFRIGSEVAAGVRGVREFKDQVAQTQVTTRDLRETWKATTAEIVASAQKQVAAEKEKIAVLRQQIEAQQQVTAGYLRGSEERQLSTKAEIDLQRKLQVALGETATASVRAGRTAAGGAAERDASGILRGAASRSGVAGVGLSALAGPGFIAGAVIGGTLDFAVKAARSEQVAEANLRNALRDTNQQRAISRKGLDEYVQAQEHATGFDRNQVMQTLSLLIRSTGSLTKARQEEGVVANIARARQTDLAGAYMLVVKAGMGNVGALRRLGIEVAKTTTYEDQLKAAHLTGNAALEKRAKALDLAATKSQVMAAVTQKVAGDSSAYMHTFAGRTAELSNTFRDLEVTIGNKAIPVLTRLFGWVNKEIDAAKQSTAVHKALHDVTALLTLAWKGIKDTLELVKPIFEWLAHELERHRTLAKALAITLGVLFTPLIVSVPIAIGYIVEKWKTIRRFFKTLWDDIQAVFFIAWDKMKIGAAEAVLAIIEPFSHLPGSMGKWARDMKDNLHGQLVLMRQDAAREAALIGGGAGKAMYTAYLPWMQQITAATSGAFNPGQAFSGSARGGTPAGSGSPGKGGLGGGNFQQGNIVRTARTQIGIPYQLGGAQLLGHPTDCAGLAHAVLAQNGIHVGTTSEQQWTQGSPVKWGDLQPGDLVFFDTHDSQKPPSHVGIYIGGGQFIEDPHTGASVRVSSLMSGYYHDNYMGARRYVQTVSHAASSTGDPSRNTKKRGNTAPADPAFQAALDAATQAAAAAKSAKAGLKTPSLTRITGTIDAELRALPAELDPVEKAAVKHIRDLRASLHVGMSQDELAKDEVALKRWGKVLKDEIHKNASEATKQADAEKKALATKIRAQGKEFAAAQAEANRIWQNAFQADVSIIDRTINEQWAIVQRDFDRTTQAHVVEMQRSAQADLTQMQRAFQAQMTLFDRDTQKGLDSLTVAQTPEEQALAAFVAQRDAANQAQTDQQQQSDLQAAYASGDPQQIAQALDAINQTSLDKQQQGLQAAADASRTAQDKKTAADQQAYQDQRDALKQSLADNEAVLEQGRQDRAAADQQGYEDDRARQWQALNDIHDDAVKMFDADLADWNLWLSKKQKSWAAFLTWLQQNPVSKGFDGGTITNPQGAADSSSLASLAAIEQRAGDSGIAAYLRSQIPVHQAAGGLTMRPTVTMRGEQGPEATFPLSGQQGQAAVAELARAIVAASGGRTGGGTTIYGTFLGATERQVGRALEGIVTPATSRVTRYSAPI